MSLLSLLPVVVAIAIGPVIVMRWGKVRTVTVLRLLVPLSCVLMAWTTRPLLGTAGYWASRALFMMSQPISFAFAMEAAERKAVVAASAWLNVTYWLGTAVAAPVTGIFLARSDYATPFYLAAVAAVLAGLSNQIFFAPKEKLLKGKASS
jgi:predicted MFS family arabinose efflux permease